MNEHESNSIGISHRGTNPELWIIGLSCVDQPRSLYEIDRFWNLKGNPLYQNRDLRCILLLFQRTLLL